MRNKRQSGLRSLISNWRRRKSKSKLPPQPVTAIVYTAAAHSANLWTPESAQGQMLEQLGFTLAKLPAGLNASQSQGKRHDIIQLGGENLAAGVKWRVTIPVRR
ncbi:ferrienterobactin-binding periplasmic protein [Escherichia coli]|uniref:Ferrienterobactin-binding periplasmic protein n=1 Tax=Escherichia coli TaxID=562 RepID=A0A2X1Q0E1_ECOLX|nr:ferrienterobactin-binding periplasmic protein [Escherichia coli]